jgi:uncharacterized membrane protein
MFLLAVIFPILLIAFLVLLDKVNHLNRRVTKLEDELESIGKRQAPISPITAAASPPPQTQITTPAQAPPQPLSPVNMQKPQAPIAEVAKPAIPLSVETNTATRQHREQPRTQKEWEQLIGGKLLNRIGALALIIGVGFFLKYAFDNNWISEWMRVLIGVAFGSGTLALAVRTQKRGFQIFSQGLSGAGIAILYLSAYASYNFYHLLPQAAAIIAMSAVTGIAFSMAIRYSAQAIAFLGWGGGFLTPFLMGAGEANVYGLFSYLALLNLGMLVIVYYKPLFNILTPLSLLANFFNFLYWQGDNYQTDKLPYVVGFLAVIWGMYIIYDIICHIRKSANNKPRYFSAVLNVGLLYWGLSFVIETRESMALFSAIIAAAYLGVFLAVYRHIVDEKISQTIYLLTTIIMLSAAIALEFRSFNIVIGWSVEAIILIGCGLGWKRKIVTQAALVLLAAAGMGLMTMSRTFAYEPIDTFTILLNARALTLIIFAAVLGGSAFLMSKFKSVENEIALEMMRAGCAIVIFGLLTLETLDYFRNLMAGLSAPQANEIAHYHLNMILPSIWIILSLPLLWFGMARKSNSVGVISIGISMIAIAYLVGAGAVYSPIENYSFIMNLRVLAILVMLGSIYIQGRILAANGETYQWASQILNISRIVLVLLGLFLLTVEAWDIFEKQIAAAPLTSDNSNLGRLRDLQQLTLSGIWLMYSVITMVLGLWRCRRSIRIISICLFGISILKIFTYDLSFLDTLYRIFSFIGLGIILLAVSYAYQRYKEVIFGGPDSV